MFNIRIFTLLNIWVINKNTNFISGGIANSAKSLDPSKSSSLNTLSESKIITLIGVYRKRKKGNVTGLAIIVRCYGYKVNNPCIINTKTVLDSSYNLAFEQQPYFKKNATKSKYIYAQI